MTDDGAKLPFLPPVWLASARSEADMRGHRGVEDVPADERDAVLKAVGLGMALREVQPPDGWEKALAQQCGWE